MCCISFTCITPTWHASLLHVTLTCIFNTSKRNARLRIEIQCGESFGVSFDLHPQFQLHWSLFNGTWQRNNRELDHRLRFETEEMTLPMPQAVLTCIIWHFSYLCCIFIMCCIFIIEPLLSIQYTRVY